MTSLVEGGDQAARVEIVGSVRRRRRQMEQTHAGERTGHGIGSGQIMAHGRDAGSGQTLQPVPTPHQTDDGFAFIEVLARQAFAYISTACNQDIPHEFASVMSFKIEILPDGPSFEANPGETLLRAALRQDVELPNGCRGGHCGACAITLKSGFIHYPSGQIEALHGRPAGTCLTCQAVAHSDLTIELAPPPTRTL